SYTLYGDQVLVFYLGGIPSTTGSAGTLGFSTNPQNPAAAGGTRKGPFFEFVSGRLVMGPNGFFRYNDPFSPGHPYIHFSSNGAGNDYNATGDNPNFGDVPSPYFEGSVTSMRFMNRNSFQIICAGPDGVFGPGGLWDSTAGATPQAAKDDLAN